jgi:hypothetical protein
MEVEYRLRLHYNKMFGFENQEVTSTEAFLAPAIEYDFETELLLPDKLSEPDQRYVYEPLPARNIRGSN